MNGAQFWHLLIQGGFAMGIIALCSVIALGVAVERAIALWGISHSARALGDTVARSLFRGDFAEGRAACERSSSPAADIFLAAFTRRTKAPMPAVEAAVDRERQAVVVKLRAHLWALGTIGAIAPFIGLFGTVWGIMRAFDAMAAAGTGGFAVVAQGISEALITTAAGIIVGVEAVVLYNFFQARLGRIMIELKLVAEEFLEVLKEKSEEPPRASASA
jgi:biopolymer transport protein ExbB